MFIFLLSVSLQYFRLNCNLRILRIGTTSIVRNPISSKCECDSHMYKNIRYQERIIFSCVLSCLNKHILHGVTIIGENHSLFEVIMTKYVNLESQNKSLKKRNCILEIKHQKPEFKNSVTHTIIAGKG